MADVNTTINPATGGVTSPYGSLALAEADDFGCSSGQSVLCEYVSTTPDTTAVTINTTVPSAIEISVQEAYRHNGVVSAGAVLAPSSGAYAIQITIPNTTLRYLRIDCTSITNSGIFWNNFDGNSYFNNLFVHNLQAGDYGYRIQYNAANVVTGYRSIASSQAGSGSGIGFYTSIASATFHFCVAWMPAYCGFSGSTITMYACVSVANYACLGTPSGDYNADNEGNISYQAPSPSWSGGHSLTPANELTDPENDDFTIKTGGTGTLIDAVATTAYDAYFPDIAGNPKNGTYADCGAFEVPSAGTTSVNSDLTAVYDMRAIVYSTQQILFDIFNTISSSQTVTFDIYNLVQADLDILFDIYSLVQSDLTLVFDMAGVVNSDQTITFDIFNRLQSDLLSLFDILNITYSDQQVVFDILGLVQSDLTLLYDTRSQVDSDLQIIYDQAGKVKSDLQLLFDILSGIVKQARGLGRVGTSNRIN